MSGSMVDIQSPIAEIRRAKKKEGKKKKKPQDITRWLYCVGCPQYSTRLEALGCLCDCVSERVQQVVKVICYKAHRRRRGMVECYSTVASNVSSHEGTMAPAGEYY